GARSRRRTWSSSTICARHLDMSASAQGLRQVGYFDCPGGGQVVVDGRVAYGAHMKAPHGTSIVDVSDPKSPRQLATLDIPVAPLATFARASGGHAPGQG